MNRKLKALGLALVAALAMSAVAAASASAAEFHSEIEGTVLTSEAKTAQVFSTTTGSVTCQKVETNATIEPKTTTEITVVPTYKECRVKKGTEEFNATVDFNSCAYVFTVGTLIEEPHHKYDGSVHIECAEPNDEIEVRVTIFQLQCLDIPAQTPTVPTVDYTNEGTGTSRDIRLISTVEGITYTETGECAGEAPTHKNDGVYTGEVTVQGEDHEQNPVGVWVT